MKIICIATNYVAHAEELNSSIQKKPTFFIKPDSAILQKNRPFYLPDFSDNVHYEVEVLVRINRLGKNIGEKFAHRYYQEVGLGIDFTARDIQEECKKNGLPWECAKAFDSSAVISQFIDKSEFDSLDNMNFNLKKNGELVQEGNTKDMIHSIDRIIAHVSKFMTLKIGDIIYTGTPVGVGPVNISDRLEGELEGRKLLDFMVK